MSKLFQAIFFVWLCLLQSCGVKEQFSKEEFQKRIIKSFDSVRQFSSLDKERIIYVDTAYDMPLPVYKAMVINGSAPYDSVYFYYYRAKDIQKVFKLRYSTEHFEQGSRLFECGNVLSDSTTGNFLVYFRSCHAIPEAVFDLDEVPSLDFALSANFGFIGPKVELLEVKMDTTERVPPPPPPPPKPKNKKVAR